MNVKVLVTHSRRTLARVGQLPMFGAVAGFQAGANNRPITQVKLQCAKCHG